GEDDHHHDAASKTVTRRGNNNASCSSGGKRGCLGSGAAGDFVAGNIKDSETAAAAAADVVSGTSEGRDATTTATKMMDLDSLEMLLEGGDRSSGASCSVSS
ncbi:unnamed protein product, partial [Laminaria digitata]